MKARQTSSSPSEWSTEKAARNGRGMGVASIDGAVQYFNIYVVVAFIACLAQHTHRSTQHSSLSISLSLALAGSHSCSITLTLSGFMQRQFPTNNQQHTTSPPTQNQVEQHRIVCLCLCVYIWLQLILSWLNRNRPIYICTYTRSHTSSFRFWRTRRFTDIRFM